MNVMCILTDEFEELEAVGTMALPRKAGIRVDVCAIDRTATTGHFDTTISNLVDVKDVNTADYDMLFLPGGPHYQRLEVDERVLSILKDFMNQGRPVNAIYAAPATLGGQGYLKDRKHTYFTSMSEDFGGVYMDQYAVIDGAIITGRNAVAMIDFAFTITEKLEGEKKAEEVKISIYY